MGTHPIFESDFDCLTAMVQRLTYRRTCLTTPLPTEERLSRPQAESWSTNTFPKLPKPQNAVTLLSPSVVSRPAVHVNWLSTQRDRRLSAVLMVVPSHLALSVPASSAPF